MKNEKLLAEVDKILADELVTDVITESELERKSKELQSRIELIKAARQLASSGKEVVAFKGSKQAKTALDEVVRKFLTTYADTLENEGLNYADLLLSSEQTEALKIFLDRLAQQKPVRPGMPVNQEIPQIPAIRDSQTVNPRQALPRPPKKSNAKPLFRVHPDDQPDTMVNTHIARRVAPRVCRLIDTSIFEEEFGPGIRDQLAIGDEVVLRRDMGEEYEVALRVNPSAVFRVSKDNIEFLQ